MTPEEMLLAAMLPHLEAMTDEDLEIANSRARAILDEMEREGE